jgi:hypothetical protein
MSPVVVGQPAATRPLTAPDPFIRPRRCDSPLPTTSVNLNYIIFIISLL